MQRIATLALAGILCAGGLLGQAPEFKSQEEFDAFMAVQQAPSVADRVAAGEQFIAEHPQSAAVGLAAYMTMLSYQQMNDYENMLLYGEMVLAANPAPSVETGTLIVLAGAIPRRTREFDLDKDEKLSKAEDHAKRAMALIPTLEKMDPAMEDDAWLATKMEFMSQCHEALGLVLSKREDYPGAEAALRKAMDMAQEPVPDTLYNLALALDKQGKKEEAANLARRCTAAGGFRDGSGADLCAAYVTQGTP